MTSQTMIANDFYDDDAAFGYSTPFSTDDKSLLPQNTDGWSEERFRLSQASGCCCASVCSRWSPRHDIRMYCMLQWLLLICCTPAYLQGMSQVASTKFKLMLSVYWFFLLVPGALVSAHVLRTPTAAARRLLLQCQLICIPIAIGAGLVLVTTSQVTTWICKEENALIQMRSLSTDAAPTVCVDLLSWVVPVLPLGFGYFVPGTYRYFRSLPETDNTSIFWSRRPSSSDFNVAAAITGAVLAADSQQ